MYKKVFHLIVSFAVLCTALIANKVDANDAETFYDVTNLKGMNVEVLSDGYKLKNTGGNNLAVSELAALAFDYEVNIEFVNNGAALLFGAANSNYQSIGTFFGLEITREGTPEAAMIFIKLFQDGAGGLGDGIIEKTMVLTNIDTTQPLHVKMSVDQEKNLNLFIADQKIDYTMKKDFKTNYVGGYIGMLTWNATANFKHIKVVRYSKPANNFITNLDTLKALNGSWMTSEDGMVSSGSGDNFSLSKSQGDDFIYEADVRVGNSGAASLIFRSDESDPKKSYVANINRQDKSIRLFKFPSGANIGSATLPNSEKEWFHLKIVAIGNTFQYYVDDVLLVAGKDNDYTSGYFGLLTWNGSMTYQNVKQTAIRASDLPTLKGLEILGNEVILSPTFSEEEIFYTGFLSRKSESIQIKAESDAADLSVSLLDGNGVKLVDSKPLISSVVSDEIAVPVGESNLYITMKQGSAERTVLVKLTRKTSAEDMAKEAQRAQLHFSPELNFMNDPNGLVFDPSDGKWHMFFQYSPQLGYMGSQTWGHAVSADLMSWEELPVAIPMDDLGAIFSGSCIVDETNSTGFFTDNKPGESKLVAMFTHAGAVQQQSIAYSKDHGLTWIKYDGNPVINNEGMPYGWDFRDPKIFRYDDTWLCVVAGGRGRLFSSDNLIDWKHEQDFTYPDGSELHSECPDLFPLTIEGTNEVKWVYNGSSEFYVIGDLVKTSSGGYNFVAETKQIASPTGRTYMYAGQSFYNDGTGQNRRILVSWLQDYSAPQAIAGKRYNGFQSVGTEITLKKIENTYMLIHYPVAEVDAFRDKVLYQKINDKVSSQDPNILQNVSGQTYDIDATFTLGSASEFGFNLRTGDGQKIVFKYNQETRQMVLDKSSSGSKYNEIVTWDLQPMEGNKIKLRALVDNGVIETYGNDGEGNISDLCFPDMDSVGMEFFVSNGDVTIDELYVYDMKSMYTGKAYGTTGETPTLLSLASPEKVELGETFRVHSTVFPNSAINKEVDWTYDDALEKIEQKDGYITLKAKAKGTYEVQATTKAGNLTKTVKVNVIERHFHTNLLDWRSLQGNWNPDEFGMFGKNAGIGDSFYVSDTNLSSTTAFVYEGDIVLEEGQAAGLVFGVKDVANPASSWYCVNIDKSDGITKLFQNTGGQNWSVQRNLTESEKAQKNFAIKIVYDGAGTLTFYVNDEYVGEKTNSGYGGGYFGILTYRANAYFDHVHLTSDGNITAIESVFETIYVEQGSGVTHEALKANLANQVIVCQDDGLRRWTDIQWDSSAVNLDAVGEYVLVGTLDDSNHGRQRNSLPTVEIKVVVKKQAATLVAINPQAITLTISDGMRAEQAFAKLNKTVQATYSDGTVKALKVTGWDAAAVGFGIVGNYEAVGYLDDDDSTQIKIMVSIVSAQEEQFETAPMGLAKTSNQIATGDATNLDVSMILLVLSGIILLRSRYRKQTQRR